MITCVNFMVELVFNLFLMTVARALFVFFVSALLT